jgi:hypothetical protein
VPAHRLPSLRRALNLWLTVAFLGTVGVLAAASLAAERTIALQSQSAAAASFIAHLATMPELGGAPGTAQRHLGSLAPELAAAGAAIQLVPESVPRDPSVLAWRRAPVTPGDYELRYRATRARLAPRAVLVHAMYGALGLGVLLLGAQRILRARIQRPLSRIAHQVRFMTSGGGWRPKLPPPDAELVELERALYELGPALDSQVREWIDAERRAGVACALSEVRRRLQGPVQEALAISGDLQARDAVSPPDKHRLRALATALERCAAAVRDVESETFTAPKTAP